MGLFQKVELKTLNGKIIAKRMRTSGGMYGTGTDYYVTIEADNGERIELLCPANKYGLHVENDKVVVTYKKTKILNITRQ